jgi:hypothetical protein
MKLSVFESWKESADWASGFREINSSVFFFFIEKFKLEVVFQPRRIVM